MPSEKLKLIPKINLSPNASALSVSLFETGKLVKCTKDDNLMLYTEGLRTCIAIMVNCELKNGQRIIGVAHSPYENNVVMDDVIEEKKTLDTIIKVFDFHKEKLMNLLLSICSLENYDNEEMHVFVAGGEDDNQRYEKYCLYINNIPKYGLNVKLKGTHFNPFEISREISHGPLDTTSFSLTAAINSAGTPLLAKTIDFSFEYNAKKIPDEQALEQFFSEQQIKPFDRDTLSSPEEMVRGFANLTNARSEELEKNFSKGQGLWYVHHSLFSENTLFSKTAKDVQASEELPSKADTAPRRSSCCILV